MPSLNLRNPLRRDPSRPTLKQRAATLKATAARVIRKPKPLPAPGSPEAVAAFGAACRAVDRASFAVDGEREALKIGTGLQYWTSDVIQQAQMGNFSRVMPEDVEAAKCTPKTRLEELLILALRRELRMAEAAKDSRIRELHALVYGDEPDPADEDEASSQFECAALDAGLIALGREFDALHAAWRQAEDANREPAARRRAVEDTARAQGLTDEAFYAVEKTAWHLPGVAEAHDATDAAFEALEPVSREIFAAQAHTAAGVAIKARAVIPAIWGGGDYEEDAGSPHEDWDRSAVRQMIEAACAAASVDWRGQPVSGQALPSAAASLVDQILASWREYGIDVGMSDEEASERTQALAARRYALIDAAEALPATRENVPAKALALAWLEYLDNWQSGQTRDAYTINGRLGFDIDTAICGRMLTEY